MAELGSMFVNIEKAFYESTGVMTADLNTSRKPLQHVREEAGFELSISQSQNVIYFSIITISKKS